MSTRPVTRRRPSLLRHGLARLRRLGWVAPALALALFLAAIPGQAGPSGSITASHAAPRSAAPAAATARRERRRPRRPARSYPRAPSVPSLRRRALGPP